TISQPYPPPYHFPLNDDKASARLKGHRRCIFLCDRKRAIAASALSPDRRRTRGSVPSCPCLPVGPLPSSVQQKMLPIALGMSRPETWTSKKTCATTFALSFIMTSPLAVRC